MSRCRRCDDFCAQKEGKRDRKDYREKLPIPEEGVLIEEIRDGYCKQQCKGWPFSYCKVSREEASDI